jgi:hypothetical protein
MIDALEWLESTSIAALVRESQYGFVVAVAVHILGLIVSAGTLLWVDLRLVGAVLPRVPALGVYRSLAPWFLAGFAVMVASGLALFAAFASAAVGNTFFRIKIVALLLAAANALAFHALARRAGAAWDGSSLPAGARLAGAASLALWATIIVCGRFMSYTMFSAP